MTIIVKHGEMECFRAYLQFLSIKVAKNSKSDCALHELDICNLELELFIPNMQNVLL